MRASFLDLLACPVCDAALDLASEPPVTESADGHLLEGGLACRGCEASYPIRGGVPRLLPDEARRSAQREETARRFGYEWNEFSDFDLEEERSSMATWLRPRSLRELAGRTVLDAGCGMGRHITVSCHEGVGRIVGIDLGHAVEAAFANTRHLEQACIVQGDLYHPPVANEAFDVVYSLGVIHHVPEPRRGFLALTRKVRPGGFLHLWLYGREGNGWILYVANPIRRLTSRLPLPLVQGSSFLISLPLWVWTRILARAPALARHVPYGAYLGWLGRYSFRKLYAIVFDHALAPVAFYLSRAEVEELVTAEGFSTPELEHSRGMSWGVTVRRTPSLETASRDEVARV